MIILEKFTIAKLGDTDPQGIVFTDALLDRLVDRHGEMKAGYYLQKDSRRSFQAYDISHFTSKPTLDDDELKCTVVIADTPRGRLLQEAYQKSEVDFKLICDVSMVTKDGRASVDGIKYIMAIDHDMLEPTGDS